MILWYSYWNFRGSKSLSVDISEIDRRQKILLKLEIFCHKTYVFQQEESQSIIYQTRYNIFSSKKFTLFQQMVTSIMYNKLT